MKYSRWEQIETKHELAVDLQTQMKRRMLSFFPSCPSFEAYWSISSADGLLVNVLARSKDSVMRIHALGNNKSVSHLQVAIGEDNESMA